MWMLRSRAPACGLTATGADGAPIMRAAAQLQALGRKDTHDISSLVIVLCDGNNPLFHARTSRLARRVAVYCSRHAGRVQRKPGHCDSEHRLLRALGCELGRCIGRVLASVHRHQVAGGRLSRLGRRPDAVQESGLVHPTGRRRDPRSYEAAGLFTGGAHTGGQSEGVHCSPSRGNPSTHQDPAR